MSTTDADAALPPSQSPPPSEEVEVVEVVEVNGKLPPPFVIEISNLSANYHRQSQSRQFRHARDASSTISEVKVKVVDVSRCSSGSGGFRFVIEIANPIVILSPSQVLLLHNAMNRRQNLANSMPELLMLDEEDD